MTDTLFSVNALKLAYKATILYHEATFDQNLKDKAEETFHSTAEDAATIAHKAEVQRLVISHFSARYTNQFVLLKEARKIFPDTWVATELRPIMTDPEHERGIIKAKIQIDTSVPGKGPSKGGFRPGGGKGKYFRPRRSFDRQGDSRGGGRPYDNRGRSGGGRPYDNRGGSGGGRPYDNRGGGGRPYDNRGGGGRPYDNRGGGGGYRRDYDDRGSSRPPYDNRGGGGRPPYDNRGGGRSYDDRGGRPYDNRGPRDWDNRDSRDNRGGPPPRDYDNRNRRFDNRDNRDNRDDRYERRDRDRDNSPKDFDKDMDQSKLPIKPRTPYDDFDRF